jgi:hypothetical protein
VAQDLTFAAGLAATLPGIVSPSQFLGEVGDLFLALMDLVMGLAAGVLYIIGATES